MNGYRIWAIFLLVVVVSLLTCNFDEQLVDSQVALHLLLLSIAFLTFVYPLEDIVLDIGLSLSNLHEIIFYRSRENFLRYSCMRIFVHWAFTLFYPVLFFGYFVHGSFFMNSSTVPRFSPFLDHPQEFFASFCAAVGAFITACAVMSNYTRWNFYKFFKNHPEYVDRLNQQIPSPNTYRYDLSKTLNKTIYMTDEFFVYVTNWNIIVTRLREATITVTNVTNHALDTMEDDTKQLLTVQLDFLHAYLTPVQLPMTISMFQYFYHQRRVPVFFGDGITIELSREEKFLREFERIVMSNEARCNYEDELQPCFGCGGNGRQVKLMKLCDENRRDFIIDRHGEAQPLPPCTSCRCDPYWCILCMGRIFYASQDKENMAEAFYGTSNCPTCRRVFCMDDVMPVYAVPPRPVVPAAPAAPVAPEANQAHENDDEHDLIEVE